MFYHLYEGKVCIILFLSNYSGVYAYIPSTFLIFFLTQSRLEFEGDLIERFGSLVKMPLLKADRYCLPNKMENWFVCQFMAASLASIELG